MLDSDWANEAVCHLWAGIFNIWQKMKDIEIRWEKNEQTRTERTMTTNFDQNAPYIHIQMNIVAYSNNTVAIWYEYEIKWQAQVHKYIYGKWLFFCCLAFISWFVLDLVGKLLCDSESNESKSGRIFNGKRILTCMNHDHYWSCNFLLHWFITLILLLAPATT